MAHSAIRESTEESIEDDERDNEKHTEKSHAPESQFVPAAVDVADAGVAGVGDDRSQAR